jgi:hypothetical protein
MIFSVSIDCKKFCNKYTIKNAISDILAAN